jgi:hypothetical protein
MIFPDIYSLITFSNNSIGYSNTTHQNIDLLVENMMPNFLYWVYDTSILINLLDCLPNHYYSNFLNHLSLSKNPPEWQELLKLSHRLGKQNKLALFDAFSLCIKNKNMPGKESLDLKALEDEIDIDDFEEISKLIQCENTSMRSRTSLFFKAPIMIESGNSQINVNTKENDKGEESKIHLGMKIS